MIFYIVDTINVKRLMGPALLDEYLVAKATYREALGKGVAKGLQSIVYTANMCGISIAEAGHRTRIKLEKLDSIEL